MGIIIKLLLGVVTSFYLFPISFSFAPQINTKIILAALGGLWFIFDHKVVSMKLNISVLVSSLIALIFSIICLISSDINNTKDYSYASYIMSYAIWMFSAYFVGACIRAYYGVFSFKYLTFYMLGVCVFQCIMALLIDFVPEVQQVVDSVVSQGQSFYKKINRLYGIGAALDSAGVRFAVVLLMTGVLLSEDTEIRKSTKQTLLILVAFFFVALVGNIISRTTFVGLLPAFLYFFFFSGLIKVRVFFDSIKLGLNFAFVLTLAIAITAYLYYTDVDFYENIRFAFEGFFNWVETGEWRTDSTDKLNNEMWIWPEDTKTWIIGTGIFGNFEFGTDIGYCRFILYCGLTGFSVFALLFVYNAIAFMYKVPNLWKFFVILLILTFLIWVKVSTDIFFIYALFYSIDKFLDEEQVIPEKQVSLV